MFIKLAGERKGVALAAGFHAILVLFFSLVGGNDVFGAVYCLVAGIFHFIGVANNYRFKKQLLSC